MPMRPVFALFVASLALAACAAPEVIIPDPISPDVPVAGTADAAERACLRDVAEASGDPLVVLLGSEFSAFGTSVRVGVGPTRTPWLCTGYADGTTDSVAPLAAPQPVPEPVPAL